MNDEPRFDDEKQLTHLDREGRASMVDVSEKESTHRLATAMAIVKMFPETLQMVRSASGKKGEVLQVARLAGIMAAKKTEHLIPLCHSIALTKVKVDFDFLSETEIQVTATAKCVGQTGVEMEALVAASTASLTIYDMCKAVDRGMVIGDLKLVEKSGGKSGDWKLGSNFPEE